MIQVRVKFSSRVLSHTSPSPTCRTGVQTDFFSSSSSTRKGEKSNEAVSVSDSWTLEKISCTQYPISQFHPQPIRIVVSSVLLGITVFICFRRRRGREFGDYKMRTDFSPTHLLASSASGRVRAIEKRGERFFFILK